MSPHLLIDARAVQKNVDGISRFALNVTKCIMENRREWKISLLMQQNASFHMEGTDAAIIHDNSSRFRANSNKKLSRRINSLSPDVFLNFSMAGPQPEAPTIVTVHDLMVLNLPCYFGDSVIRNAFSRALFQRALSRSVGHAEAVAVPTMATKLDVLRRSIHPPARYSSQERGRPSSPHLWKFSGKGRTSSCMWAMPGATRTYPVSSQPTAGSGPWTGPHRP